MKRAGESVPRLYLKEENKMAKVIDITDKLTFETNPVIKIKNVEIEVNSDAVTILKVIGLFKEKDELDASLEAAELILGKGGMEKVRKMNLQMKDFISVIRNAVNIAMGEEETEGEAETHTTI